MSFPALGVNTKVVDIDKIYLNMRYRTARKLSKNFYKQFFIKNRGFSDFARKRVIRFCSFRIYRQISSISTTFLLTPSAGKIILTYFQAILGPKIQFFGLFSKNIARIGPISHIQIDLINIYNFCIDTMPGKTLPELLQAILSKIRNSRPKIMFRLGRVIIFPV